PDENGNVNVAGGGGGGAVSSVAGKVGDVTLDTGDIVGLSAALGGKAAASHTHSAADITSGQLPPERLGIGSTGGSTRFLREDGVFAVPEGTGGGTGTVNSVNGKNPDGSGNVNLVKGD